MLLGFTFLWAFFDKTFGLGYTTTSSNAWIHTGSPTYGFLAPIPIDEIDYALSDTVQLRVTRDAVSDYPSVPFRRPGHLS